MSGRSGSPLGVWYKQIIRFVITVQMLCGSGNKNRQILMRFLCCAGYLFIRAINSANKDQERQDKIDGY